MKVSIFPLKTISNIAARVVAFALTVKPCMFKLSRSTARTKDDATVLFGTAILSVAVIRTGSLPQQQIILGGTYPRPKDLL